MEILKTHIYPCKLRLNTKKYENFNNQKKYSTMYF